MDSNWDLYSPMENSTQTEMEIPIANLMDSGKTYRLLPVYAVVREISTPPEPLNPSATPTPTDPRPADNTSANSPSAD